MSGVAILAVICGYALHALITRPGSPTEPSVPIVDDRWVAAAPGRIEPKSGEVGVGPSIPGRIARILVAINDRVERGDLLIQLADDEARTQLDAAEAEAASRKRARDAQSAIRGREDVRRAEDALYTAERTQAAAQLELDAAEEARRANQASPIASARKRLADARDRVQQEKAALAAESAKPNLPLPNRFEAALTAARTTVAVAQSHFDKTRIRAPLAGSVLQLRARIGESVVPSPDAHLVVVGDPREVLVKAEIRELDVAKVKVGATVLIRNDAFPGQQFEGRVTALAPTLSSARITLRGPRRPTDVDILQATIEFDEAVPLRPGQPVDVYIRRASRKDPRRQELTAEGSGGGHE